MPQRIRIGPSGIWLPGTNKPQGVPVIDWSHPMTRGLVFYAFDTGMGQIIDLVSGTIAGLNSSSGTAATSGATRFGAGVQYNKGQASYFRLPPQANSSIGSIAWGMYAPPGAQSSLGTFAYTTWTGSYNGVNVGYQDCEFSDSTGSNHLACYDGVNGLFYDNASVPPLTNASSVYVSGVITRDGATRTLYGYNSAKGGPAVAGSVACSDTILTAFADLALGDYANSSNPGGLAPVFPYLGFVFYWGLWNILMPRQDITQVSLDPYCFLLPPDTPQEMILQSGRLPLIGVG